MGKFEKINKEVLKKIEEGKRVPLLKIIRLKCLECCCWQSHEVSLCTIPDCILYHYRMGKNPVPKKMSESQRKASIERLAKARKEMVKK